MTLLFFLSCMQDVYADILRQSLHGTYLRWNMQIDQDEVTIEKNGDRILIKSFDEITLREIKTALLKNGLDNRYFKRPDLGIKKERDNIPYLTLQLQNEEIDLFKFYQENKNRQIVDFWMGSPKRAQKKPKLLKKMDVIKTKSAAISKKKLKKRNKKIKKVVKDKKYRDFRYGASFIWDYPPSRPMLRKIVNLNRKTPEFFYEIKDRDPKDKREIHLQLAINLFRKRKWGLMYKSIKLFQKKYGDSYEEDLLEYLKINAILRENLQNLTASPAKTAINMLTALGEKTDNHALKKAAFKYLTQYHIDKKQNAKALAFSKRLYSMGREKKDFNLSRYSAEAILYNLARLGRSNKIENLIKDKNIKALLPFQLRFAYASYALMKEDKEKELIKRYNKNKRRMASPVHGSIIFNVAEAYFRTAKYKKAIKMFDRYIADHSYSQHSSPARVRLALSYEILGKNINQTVELYKNAVNRSGKNQLGYEAAIRYVALKSVRNKRAGDKDRELRTLLNRDNDEKKLNKNIKKLLWLVRLRTFIADGKLEEALAYLKAIPLNLLNVYERNVFLGDGAEIVYGMIDRFYKQENYFQVVNLWRSYKDKYMDKVANDPYMNLVIGKSYLKLGLLSKMEEVLSSFEKNKHAPKRTFPIWNGRSTITRPDVVVAELRIMRHMKLKNWQLALKEVDMLAKIKPQYGKINYFRGVISYQRRKYKETINHMEKFLARQKNESIDDLELANILMAYTDSIYQLGDIKKFKRVTKAVLNDVKNHDTINPYLLKVKERVAYLNIEVLYGEGVGKTYTKIEKMILDFKKAYKKSVYLGRVNYILGMTLVAGRKIDDGRKVFFDLIKNKTVPEHVKQLARSELSLLEIREKTI
ncbi:MAG: hypothetical protein OXB84_04650 [Halobacteriovoraceae bacterium]|nr:hypothetical protein [Halobacteriovoraceae bacterium]